MRQERLRTMRAAEDKEAHGERRSLRWPSPGYIGTMLRVVPALLATVATCIL
jgi:hypothetical protein